MDLFDPDANPTRRMDDLAPADTPTRRMDGPPAAETGVPTRRLTAADAVAAPDGPVLAELTLESHDQGPLQGHMVTLRLTPRTLTAVPDAAARARLNDLLGEIPDRLVAAPDLIQQLADQVLGWVQERIDSVLAPHPLHDTELWVADGHFHMRLGLLTIAFHAGNFDPDAARAFLREYEAAKAAPA
jgi:hypothetical protein